MMRECMEKKQVHQVTHKLEGHLTPFLIMLECMKKKQVHQVTHKLEEHLTPFLIMMECMEKKQIHQVTHNLKGNLTPFLMMMKWMKKNSNPILLHRKKMRGSTRNLKLAKLPTKKRLDINWRMNRPVGPNAKLFKSRCTVLVRDVKNAPLKVKEWADIKIENKIKMFDLVLFEQTGQEIDRLRLWELMHTRANGQACNEETQEKLDLLKELG
ncbi:uncharacterized protein [Arachis hypogaea]|uniref:uncharacterized protein n=1 Tax=Arachis hypogaea TaxID=3818 RepID=UPI003B228E69